MNTIKYRGQVVDGHSPDLWHDCPILGIKEDPSLGFGFTDDFLDYENTATTVVNKSGTPTFSEASAAVRGSANAGGVLELFGTTDNTPCSLQRGGSDSAPFTIAIDAADGKKLWFEARCKISLLTTDYINFFVGLCEKNLATAAFMTATDFINGGILGWRTLEATPSIIHSIAQKSTAAYDDIDATFDVFVADTYIKFGLKYDPDAIPSKRIKFYADGVEQTTYVGQESGDATIYTGDETNFPGGLLLNPVFAAHSGNAADTLVSMDWWSCYQLR